MPFHFADADFHAAAMRRCVLSGLREAATLAFGCGRVHAGMLLLRAGTRLMRPLREQVHAHGLVFAVNPGAGTAALLFVSFRLGLPRRNRAARQISPLLRRFLARQISRAFRSFAALRPLLRLGCGAPGPAPSGSRQGRDRRGPGSTSKGLHHEHHW